MCGSPDRKVFLTAKPSIVQKDINAQNYACTSLDHSFSFDIVECAACSHIYSVGVPEAEALASFYREVTDPVYLEEQESRQDTFLYYLKHLQKHSHAGAGAKLLEIGAYYGGFLTLAKKAGYQVTGIEPSAHAAAYCRSQGLNVHNAMAEQWKNLGEKYDIIVFWDVLEHIADPQSFFRSLKPWLKPGGEVFFATLDVKGIVPRLMGRHWPWFMTMHVNYYSKKTIRRLMKENGLTVSQIYYHPHTISVDYLCKKMAAMYRPLRPFFNLLRKLPFLKKIKIPFNAYDNIFVMAVNEK